MYSKLIELDEPFAKDLGFTSDLYQGWLWQKGKDIYISFIVSLQPRQGNVSKLFKRIHELGYNIKVPIPMQHMREIVIKKGFTAMIEFDDMPKEQVNVWKLQCPTNK